MLENYKQQGPELQKVVLLQPYTSEFLNMCIYVIMYMIRLSEKIIQ